jgi:hypothetical protein
MKVNDVIKQYLSVIGRKGGQSRSKKKIAASRRNGKIRNNKKS